MPRARRRLGGVAGDASYDAARSNLIASRERGVSFGAQVTTSRASWSDTRSLVELPVAAGSFTLGIDGRISTCVTRATAKTFGVASGHSRSADAASRGRVLGGFDLASPAFGVSRDAAARIVRVRLHGRAIPRSIRASSGSTRRAAGSTRSRSEDRNPGWSGRAASSAAPREGAGSRRRPRSTRASSLDVAAPGDGMDGRVRPDRLGRSTGCPPRVGAGVAAPPPRTDAVGVGLPLLHRPEAEVAPPGRRASRGVSTNSSSGPVRVRVSAEDLEPQEQPSARQPAAGHDLLDARRSRAPRLAEEALEDEPRRPSRPRMPGSAPVAARHEVGPRQEPEAVRPRREHARSPAGPARARTRRRGSSEQQNDAERATARRENERPGRHGVSAGTSCGSGCSR